MIEWLRAGVSGKAERVDREAGVLYGYVAAQEGPFKSEGRGEFDMKSLRAIVELGNTGAGLKSRLGHPTLSDDGIGKFLGRGRDFRMGKAIDARTGKPVNAVRGDLHFDRSAYDTPHGNLASYVMGLAESDPNAISSSLVLEVDEEQQVDAKGKQLVDKEGNALPPLWRPKRLHASDIVDTGDAVDGLLSAGELAQALSVGLTPELSKLLRFDNVARLSTQLLDGMFKGADREEVERRCKAWLARYLAYRFQALGPGLSHDSKTNDSEPDWGSVDKTKLPEVAFARKGATKSDWGFPHHYVTDGTVGEDGIFTDGTLWLHKGGLNAAWAAANGAHTGEKAEASVIAHLEAHRRALGIDDKTSVLPTPKLDALRLRLDELALTTRRLQS